VIDRRRPSSEASVIADAPERASGPRPATEPPTAGSATEIPPRLAERGTASDTPPRLAERRPARDSVAAPYSFDAFPVRIAGAMHEAARAYRDRVAEEIELRRIAILSGIRDARRRDVLEARAEAVHARRAVEMWALTAQRQIKRERQRRKTEIDVELRRTLREKNEELERRVREVETAIAAHRARVDAYFDAIARERDPQAIAEQARHRPAFPSLTTVSADDAAAPDGRDGPPDQPTFVQIELFGPDLV
jgi:hypothetical protein